MSHELKARLREQISKEISALPDEYISDSDEGLYSRVISFERFIAARNIMIYCSVKREPATQKIAEAALKAEKTVAFPLCYRGGIMQARVVRSLDSLRPAMLNIPTPPDDAPVIAPEELDLIIVPALTYDRNGYRIGYGGGYYDRYLRGVSALTVGLARERLLKNELPVEPHDIAVMRIVTEERFLCPIVPMK